MRAALVAVLLLLAQPAAAAAELELVRVGDFTQPVALGAPPGDPSRLFVVERRGIVRLVKDGAVVPTPFADLSRHVRVSDEGGLLGIAFPPGYAHGGAPSRFPASRRRRPP